MISVTRFDDTQRAKSPAASSVSSTIRLAESRSFQTTTSKAPTKEQFAIVENSSVRKNPTAKSTNRTAGAAAAVTAVKQESISETRSTVSRTKRQLTKPKILPSTKHSSSSNSGRSSVTTNQNHSNKPKRPVRSSNSSSGSSRCSSIIGAQDPQKLRPKRLYYQVTSTPTKKCSRTSTEDDLNNNIVQLLPDKNVLLRGEQRQDIRTKKQTVGQKSNVGLFASLTGKR